MKTKTSSWSRVPFPERHKRGRRRKDGMSPCFLALRRSDSSPGPPPILLKCQTNKEQTAIIRFSQHLQAEDAMALVSRQRARASSPRGYTCSPGRKWDRNPHRGEKSSATPGRHVSIKKKQPVSRELNVPAGMSFTATWWCWTAFLPGWSGWALLRFNPPAAERRGGSGTEPFGCGRLREGDRRDLRGSLGNLAALIGGLILGGRNAAVRIFFEPL